MEAGTTSLGTQDPDSDLEFAADPAVETNQITVSTTSKRAYVASISVYAGGGSTTYYASSVSCGTTGIEDEIVPRQSSNRKFLKDGQLLILRDGRTYTLMGNLVE